MVFINYIICIKIEKYTIYGPHSKIFYNKIKDVYCYTLGKQNES